MYMIDALNAFTGILELQTLAMLGHVGPCCYDAIFEITDSAQSRILLFFCVYNNKHIISTFFFFNYLVILVISTTGVPFRSYRISAIKKTNQMANRTHWLRTYFPLTSLTYFLLISRKIWLKSC